MTSQKIFREFIEMLKIWPVDMTKTPRCLGEHLRKKFSAHFPNGELSQNIDTTYWSKVLKDLVPIATNDILRKYPRSKATASLGLGKEHCRAILSNQGRELFKEYNESLK